MERKLHGRHNRTQRHQNVQAENPRKAEGTTKGHIIRFLIAIEETFRDGAFAGSGVTAIP